MTDLNLHRPGLAGIHAHTGIDAIFDGVALDQARQVIFLDMVAKSSGYRCHLINDGFCNHATRVGSSQVFVRPCQSQSGQSVPASVPAGRYRQLALSDLAGARAYHIVFFHRHRSMDGTSSTSVPPAFRSSMNVLRRLSSSCLSMLLLKWAPNCIVSSNLCYRRVSNLQHRNDGPHQSLAHNYSTSLGLVRIDPRLRLDLAC